MDNCIFCKIINKEIPAHLIYEDDRCIVILDKFPITKGQGLVIPKEHLEYVLDLDDELYRHLFTIAKKVGKAIDQALNTLKTCLVVEGFDVPHAHVKLFPAYKGQELSLLGQTGEEASDEELLGIVEKIKTFLK